MLLRDLLLIVFFSCQVYDMSALLRAVNDMPFLSSFYKNPRQQYQSLILKQAHGRVIWNVGIKSVVYDAYHAADIDMATQGE